ncbi:unnamed protein product [Linum trigynum]|uniref:Uncharacterized protein n=1 Tax=Linum trigynum TaxID=586398 RepID=A0AAV2GGA8_9ROSI
MVALLSSPLFGMSELELDLSASPSLLLLGLAIGESFRRTLLFLESENHSKPIHMHQNSPGGPATAALLGQAASMASLRLAAGAKGRGSHFRMQQQWSINHLVDTVGKLTI